MAESQLINTIPEGKTKVYHASCGDENREITVSLHDGPAVYTLTGTEALTLRYKKVNGEIGACAVPGTSGSDVTVTLPADVCDTAGVVFCKLRINGIGAKAFFVMVEPESEA